MCELPEKLNFLHSFIRNHLKAKILVFLSSCKQVRRLGLTWYLVVTSAKDNDTSNNNNNNNNNLQLQQ